MVETKSFHIRFSSSPKYVKDFNYVSFFFNLSLILTKVSMGDTVVPDNNVTVYVLLRFVKKSI